jgi:hypothetical protein
VIAAVLALAVFAGCGSLEKEANLDPLEVASLVRERVQEQTGVTLTSVSCPADIVLEPGASFTCAVTAADGTTATIGVEQVDDQGTLAFAAALLRTHDAEQQIARDLGDGARVNCPDLITVEQDGTFTCDAKDGGDRARLEVRFKDASGSFEYELVR